jgi:hypothetical protein
LTAAEAEYMEREGKNVYTTIGIQSSCMGHRALAGSFHSAISSFDFNYIQVVFSSRMLKWRVRKGKACGVYLGRQNILPFSVSSISSTPAEKETAD